MSVFRFPILFSEDFRGFVTAQVVGTDSAAGFAASSADALAQVKEYLQWFYTEEWWREPTEFVAPQLLEFRVDIRTEYKIAEQTDANAPRSWHAKQKLRRSKAKPKKRVFASAETLPLRVACVFREDENGNHFAAIPLLDVSFHFFDAKTLKQLVTTYVQDALKGLTPLELIRYLPPRRVWLEEIAVNIRAPKFSQSDEFADVPILRRSAEPIGAKNQSRKISKAYEREAEISDLIKRLTVERANVILLGASGVGKTAVLIEAARKIEADLKTGKISLSGEIEEPDEDFEPDDKPRHRFWQTNGSRLIAGMKYLGQWQERCEEIAAELEAVEGVLCVEKLTDLIDTGGKNPIESVAAFFMPYLQRGEMRMIVEAAPAELDACRRLLPGFAELFQIVRIDEFDREKAIAVLDKIIGVKVQNNPLQIESGAGVLIYSLFRRFMPYESFPGKTVDFAGKLFDAALRRRITENQTRAADLLVTHNQIIEQFVKLTGLPELFLRDEIALEFSAAAAALESGVIGQKAACEQVADVVTTFKANLNDAARPLGVLLFVGQTGVGKTELAKTLAAFLFGANADDSENRLIRLDMSEYNSAGAASRLLMNADGQPSELINAVRRQPFSVVLFDEIEKADGAVFDVLLGMFDEGRLTDKFGRVTNFNSAIIILTSNIGAEKFGGIGFGENSAPSFEREAQNFFRPEFFNRLDGVVKFAALSRAAVREIAEKELRSIARREGLRDKEISLHWTPEIVDFLAEKGFEPRYGARPLQRALETYLTAPLAKFLLADKSRRNFRLNVELRENSLIAFQIDDLSV